MDGSPPGHWVPTLASAEVGRGAVIPVRVSSCEIVVWRSASGVIGVAPRTCPHLDADLADGRVVGEELICAQHGWCFDVTGRAGKRNLDGRLDDKGPTVTPAIRERDGRIEALDPAAGRRPHGFPS